VKKTENFMLKVLYSFRESTSFVKKVDRLLGEEEFSKLQWQLIERPDFGNLIIGGEGLRKLRWAMKERGKRSGVRVIYYLANAKGFIFLLDIYAKNEKVDLEADEMKRLRQIVKDWLR